MCWIFGSTDRGARTIAARAILADLDFADAGVGLSPSERFILIEGRVSAAPKVSADPALAYVDFGGIMIDLSRLANR